MKAKFFLTLAVVLLASSHFAFAAKPRMIVEKTYTEEEYHGGFCTSVWEGGGTSGGQHWPAFYKVSNGQYVKPDITGTNSDPENWADTNNDPVPIGNIWACFSYDRIKALGEITNVIDDTGQCHIHGTTWTLAQCLANDPPLEYEDGGVTGSYEAIRYKAPYEYPGFSFGANALSAFTSPNVPDIKVISQHVQFDFGSMVTTRGATSYVGDNFIKPFMGSGLATLYYLRFWIVALVVISIITFFAFRAFRLYRH